MVKYFWLFKTNAHVITLQLKFQFQLGFSSESSFWTLSLYSVLHDQQTFNKSCSLQTSVFPITSSLTGDEYSAKWLTVLLIAKQKTFWSCQCQIDRSSLLLKCKLRTGFTTSTVGLTKCDLLSRLWEMAAATLLDLQTENCKQFL